jgi:hypothetical protein
VSVSQVNFYDGTYCSSYLNQVSGIDLYDLSGAGYGDSVESIEIPDAQSVRLYQEFNEVGQYVCLNGTDEMLWDNAFQNGETVANRASWLRVFSEPNCPLDFSAGVLFYADINFLGDPVWGMVGERSTDAPNHIVKSIIIPDGYSLKIWDQDGFTGNSLCMVSPVTDLSAFSWDNQQIESLQFAAGDICDGQEIDGKIPYLISPEHNEVLYGLKTPEFCWGASSQESLEFFVELKKGDGTTYTSDWISDSCWLAEDVTGIFGEYDWKVKSRTSDEDVSPWSLTYHLSYFEDIVDPTVSIIMPIEGIDVVYPRTVFRAEANDLGGVKFVYFFAWYDDGSGNGHDWHYLDVDENEADGWEIIWNLLPVAHPDTALYIVAYDYSGNDSYDLITQINVGESFTFGDGFESRGARDSVTESQNLVPTTFPELPGSSIDSEPIESGTGAQNQNEAGNGPFEQSPLPSVESASRPELPAEADLPVELIDPADGNWYWGEQTPNLCWSPASGAAFYKLSVIGEDNTFKSQWIEDTCLHPLEIQGIAGEYQWQVKYKDVNGNQSEWSASKTFYIREDLSIPEVAILDAEYAAVENSGGLQLNVSTEAVDNESGIEAVYLLAYFDDGNGVSWHKLGELHDLAAAHHQFIWKFDNPEVNIQQLWVYAIDVAGNTGTASLLGAEIAHDLQTDSSMQHYQKGLIDYAYIRLKQSDTD